VVIYAEYLFLENAITGGMILLLTGKISGVRCRTGPLIFGIILCGMDSFTLFWNRPDPVLAILAKLGFSAALVLITYRPKKLRPFLRITLVFYLVSFAMGGITIGMMYFLGIAGMTQNTAVYLGAAGYLYILPGCIATWMILGFLADLIRDRLTQERTYADVEIVLEGRTVRLQGMVDTGNFLVDPMSGKPAMVISSAAAGSFLPEEFVSGAVTADPVSEIPEILRNSSYAGRIRMIPYRCVGLGRGTLIGIRPDAVRIGIRDGKEGCRMVEAPEGTVLAISRGTFSGGRAGDGCPVLINPSIIEGGIACDV
jgi:stage II sporulation protein GA (sporulation sigma-E factor processing peptidase)